MKFPFFNCKFHTKNFNWKVFFILDSIVEKKRNKNSFFTYLYYYVNYMSLRQNYTICCRIINGFIFVVMGIFTNAPVFLVFVWMEKFFWENFWRICGNLPQDRGRQQGIYQFFAGSFDGEQGFMAEFYFKTPFSNDFTLKQTLDYPPISVLPSFMNETLQTAL